jgi:hypothetical protein
MGCVAFVLFCAVVQPVAEPDLAVVLQRAGVYVARYYDELSGIVMQESFRQTWTRATTTMVMRGQLVHREEKLGERNLQSDLALVHASGSAEWIQFRDVFAVDGSPIRDRTERLTSLFVTPTKDAAEQIARIKAESARYNLGDVDRNLNTPLFALQVLRADRQSRFRFRVTSKREPTLTREDTEGAGAHWPPADLWVVEYEETQHPTLIRTSRNKDTPAHGRLWIESATGAVLMTELSGGNRDASGTIDVRYAVQPQVGVRVPREMREKYESDSGSTIVGVATYGAIRRFQVTVDEKFLGKKR